MDFMIEQAEMRGALERDLRLGQATSLVAGQGREICEDCSAPIPAARRAAAPFASRCITCQELVERGPR